MILRRYPRYKDDMMLLWDSLRKSGYTRSYTSLVRVVRKWIKPEIQKRTVRKNKPYKRAEYPGQKVQIDVKYVPSYCVSNGQKYYQYTAVDECTRWVYREIYAEHSTYSSAQFLSNLVKNLRSRLEKYKLTTEQSLQMHCCQKNVTTKVCLKNCWNGAVLSIIGSELLRQGIMVK